MTSDTSQGMKSKEVEETPLLGTTQAKTGKGSWIDRMTDNRGKTFINNAY
jgi:hypothetical protein